MTGKGDRSVSIGGAANNTIIQTGDNNRASFELMQTTLPPADEVDLQAELVALRQILGKLNAPDQKKIGRALDDVEDEIGKEEPNRDEIGTALERALDYAKKADRFASTAEKLQKHVANVVAWLGDNWYKLLAVVGLTV